MEKTTPKINKKSPSPSLLTILKKRVTELERAEKALQLENRYLRELYDSAPLGYQSLDENGCFKEVNRAWLDILGYSRQEVIGKNFGEFLHPDWRDHFRENFPKFKAVGEILGVEFEMIKKDGSTMLVSFNGKISKNSGGKFQQTHCIFRDITFYNQVKEQSEAERRLLNICHVNTDFRKLMRDLADFFKDLTGCEAVGLRMRQGEDFPYYETRGFPENFVMAENSLCTPDLKGDLLRDSTGNPVLECMCGNVICGRFDPAKPFFTKHGSFWTNSTSELLASTSEADRRARTRNRCNGEGYESVALLPLRANNKTYGLLQFNDPRKNRFTPEKIELIEHLSEHVSLAIAKHLTDEELRISEEKYRLLFENAQEAIIITQDRRMVLVNPMAVKIIGSSAEELTSRPFSEFVHPDDREMVLDNHLKRLRGDDAPFNYKFRVFCNDGSVKWLEQNVSLITWNGKPASLNFLTDITERKIMENALLESENRFASAFEYASIGMALVSPEGCWLKVNCSICELLGYTESELLARTFQEITHPEDLETDLEYVNQMLAGKIHAYKMEKRYYHKAGHIVWALLSVSLLWDKHGKPLYFISQVEDISERKKMEDELRKSELNLRSFIDAIPESAFLINTDGSILLLNRITAERLGKSMDDMLGRNIYDFIPEDTSRNRKLIIEKVLQTKTPISFEDKRLNSHIYNSINPVLDVEGNVIRLAIVGVDITYHKQTEESLRKREAMYRALVVGLPDIVMRFDRECRHLFVSDNVCNVVDLQASQFIGKTHLELGFPETQCKFWEEAIRGVFDSGAPFETEFTFEGKNGPAIHNWRLIPERDDSGTIQSVLSLSRDVTAHRRAEQDYRTIFREMLDGFALHEIIRDSEGNPANYRFLAINPAFERMTNLKAGNILGRTVLEVLPGTEQHWIETYGRVALTGKPVFSENYSADLKKHFEVTAFRPAPNQFACIFADITERRLAEEALLKKTEDLSRYNKMMVGRELKMIQLKKEINDLLRKHGEKEKYNIHEIRNKTT